jgi:acetyl esterase/lipase
VPEIYNQASPLLFVSADAPPTFFYHGDSDVLVPADTSQAMAKALEKAGVPVETYVVRDAGHVQTFFNHPAVEAAIDYLDRQRRAAAK